MYQLLVTLGHLMIFSGAKRLDLWLLGATKGISLLIKLPFWGLQKGSSSPKMDQLCLSSNAWPVCRLWNQIWCHKDIQRVKSALYGVRVILTWFPLYCGSIWVRFPRTGILAKMWSFFLKVEPSCDQTWLYIFDFLIDPGQLCPLDTRNTLTWSWKFF